MRRRNKRIEIKMTEEELKHLNHLVRQSKLSRESYLRMIINGLVPRASPSEELIDTILLLRNIKYQSTILAFKNIRKTLNYYKTKSIRL